MVLFSEDEPVVDDDNPLYCPDISAQQFLSSVRLFQASVSDSSRFSFYQRLCSAFSQNVFKDSPSALHFQVIPSSQTPDELHTHTFGSFVYDENLPPSRNALPELSRSFGDNSTLDSSDDLPSRPAKRHKRSSSQNDASFMISSKAPRLSFVELSKTSTVPSDDSHLRASEPDLHIIGEEDLAEVLSEPETPAIIKALLMNLEKLLPGLSLQDKFDHSDTTYQDIINHLGLKGRLCFQTLSLFRNANIHAINLSESMAEVLGLNIDRKDSLKVFKLSNSFVDLRSLTLSDVPLVDGDIGYLSELFLESLFIDDTQLGDEAVMRLISLKRTLSHLELSWNKRITDDSVPTLCALSSLTFLSLKQTSITMKGVRKLACTIKSREKKTSIILPSDCEEYMLNLHQEYALKLDEQLVHDPSACATLGEEELKRNLEVHAAQNGSIETEGSRGEMARSLRKVLERRQKDMVVQEFMLEGFA